MQLAIWDSGSGQETGDSLREDPLMLGMVAMQSNGKPVVPLGVVFSSSCLLDFDLMRSRLSRVDLNILFILPAITEL